MHRVFFDINTGTAEVGFILWYAESQHDLEAIGNDLHDGLRVLLYMPDELELEAVLCFDQELGYWRGIPVT
jgi:hypothetical protein